MNIPIFLSSDNNYAPFVATTIASICDNTKSFCEFYVLDGGITKENQDKICELKKQFSNFSIEFVQIDLNNITENIEYKNNCNHVSISTYNRFLIPKLKPKIKKLLYLDVDIIALKDIVELYNQKLDNLEIGAIPEPFSILPFDKQHIYFNAGVLLINNEKWVERDIIKKLFQTEKEYRERLRWADQDVLNIVFCKNYKILENKFNFMSQNININQDMIIRHFNTAIKPWQISDEINTNLLLNHKDFWAYAKKTVFYDNLKKKAIEVTPQTLRHAKILNAKLKIQMRNANG